MNQLEILKMLSSRYIIIFGGQYGRGKSLSETALAFFICCINSKNNIVTNMPLQYPTKEINITQLYHTSQFDLQNIIKNSVYLWDELHNDLKARDFMSQKNRFINNIAVAFRKDKVTLIGSLQFFDTLELIIAEMLDVTIIPSFTNIYSRDTNEDNKLRYANKDFLMNWEIRDRKTDTEYNLKVNLYPFLKMYNTNFKPMPLITNHKEYLEKAKLKSQKQYENLIEINNDKIQISKNNFIEGFEEICK